MFNREKKKKNIVVSQVPLRNLYIIKIHIKWEKVENVVRDR